MRATRAGGSASSVGSPARALGATNSNRPAKHMSTDALLFPVKVAFMIVSPVSGPISRSLADWEYIRSKFGPGLDTPTPCNPPLKIKLLHPNSHFGTSYTLRPVSTSTTANWPKIRTLGQASSRPQHPTLSLWSACALWENACLGIGSE